MPLAVRYMCAGGSAVLLYYAAYLGLTELAGEWYLASAITASVIHFGAGFTLHRRLTFQVKGWDGVFRQAWRYLVAKCFFYLVNATGLYLLVDHWDVGHIKAQIFLTVALTVGGGAQVNQRIFTGKVEAKDFLRRTPVPAEQSAPSAPKQ